MNSEQEFASLDVKQRIAAIGESLVKADHLLPVHLSNIHRQLKQYEELVHLLSDDEIRILVSGQRKHAGVELVKQASKQRAKPLSRTTAEDL